MMTSIQDEITKFSQKHEIKLDQHINLVAAIQQLDNSQTPKTIRLRLSIKYYTKTRPEHWE